ncbi:hypothetical protein EC991_006771 [Linnemannia zychae]|nr:hypothetical protein EC991_006771 [Linnemannia zychae]
MCCLEKVFYQYPDSENSDSIIVNMTLTHDEEYLNGRFAVKVSSTGTSFNHGDVVLDFNAVYTDVPGYTLNIPDKFKPWIVPVGGSDSYDDPDPLWFLMCSMHCDVKYLDPPGFLIPGSTWVDKDCTFCDVVGGILVKRTRRENSWYAAVPTGERERIVDLVDEEELASLLV